MQSELEPIQKLFLLLQKINISYNENTFIKILKEDCFLDEDEGKNVEVELQEIKVYHSNAKTDKLCFYDWLLHSKIFTEVMRSYNIIDINYLFINERQRENRYYYPFILDSSKYNSIITPSCDIFCVPLWENFDENNKFSNELIESFREKIGKQTVLNWWKVEKASTRDIMNIVGKLRNSYKIKEAFLTISQGTKSKNSIEDPDTRISELLTFSKNIINRTKLFSYEKQFGCIYFTPGEIYLGLLIFCSHFKLDDIVKKLKKKKEVILSWWDNIEQKDRAEHIQYALFADKTIEYLRKNQDDTSIETKCCSNIQSKEINYCINKCEFYQNKNINEGRCIWEQSRFNPILYLYIFAIMQRSDIHDELGFVLYMNNIFSYDEIKHQNTYEYQTLIVLHKKEDLLASNTKKKAAKYLNTQLQKYLFLPKLFINQVINMVFNLEEEKEKQRLGKLRGGQSAYTSFSHRIKNIIQFTIIDKIDCLKDAISRNRPNDINNLLIVLKENAIRMLSAAKKAVIADYDDSAYDAKIADNLGRKNEINKFIKQCIIISGVDDAEIESTEKINEIDMPIIEGFEDAILEEIESARRHGKTDQNGKLLEVNLSLSEISNIEYFGQSDKKRKYIDNNKTIKVLTICFKNIMKRQKDDLKTNQGGLMIQERYFRSIGLERNKDYQYEPENGYWVVKIRYYYDLYEDLYKEFVHGKN